MEFAEVYLPIIRLVHLIHNSRELALIHGAADTLHQLLDFLLAQRAAVVPVEPLKCTLDQQLLLVPVDDRVEHLRGGRDALCRGPGDLRGSDGRRGLHALRRGPGDLRGSDGRSGLDALRRECSFICARTVGQQTATAPSNFKNNPRRPHCISPAFNHRRA